MEQTDSCTDCDEKDERIAELEEALDDMHGLVLGVREFVGDVETKADNLLNATV